MRPIFFETFLFESQKFKIHLFDTSYKVKYNNDIINIFL